MKKRIVYDNGSIYEGEIIAGRRSGFGVMTWPNGRRFAGVFQNDYPVKGVHTWENGAEYNGTWSKWNREGYGEMRYVNGAVYRGGWENDQRSDRGEMTWPDGRRFSGVFQSDYPVKGVHTWPNGAEYNGTWSKWNREGYGEMRYADGSLYRGEWRDDLREGEGFFCDADGSVTEGQWKKDAYVVPRSQKSSSQNSRKRSAESSDQRRGAEAERSDEQAVSKLLETGKYICFALAKEDEQYPKELRKEFSELVGLHEIKRLLSELYLRILYEKNRDQLVGGHSAQRGYNFVITGNPGTGKTTVARILAQILFICGILPENEVIETDRAGLVSDVIGGTEKCTAETIERARGKTLFIDEAYSLFVEGANWDFGSAAISTLLKDMEDHRGEYAVVLAGYKDKMENMLRKANPGFSSRFDYRIDIPDYSEEDLLKIVFFHALKQGYVIENEARDEIIRSIQSAKNDLNFDNGRYARKILEQAVNKMASRVMKLNRPTERDYRVLTEDDFAVSNRDEKKLDAHLKALNALIGLASVKDEVRRMVNMATAQKIRMERGVGKAEPQTLTFAFTGNPGTGKTTVARLLGNIYYELGFLKRKNVFVECGRADLVGQYQGHTAQKVRDRVEEALGGVLFIDEAYALFQSELDTFGKEAIDTLVQQIENHRGNIMVIFAGYTEEMQQFLRANSGLESRIAKTIAFPDYSDAELEQIFAHELHTRGYRNVCTSERVRQCISARKEQTRNFGNARGIRNRVEYVISNQAQRLASSDPDRLSDTDVITVTDEDLC